MQIGIEHISHLERVLHLSFEYSSSIDYLAHLVPYFKHDSLPFCTPAHLLHVLLTLLCCDLPREILNLVLHFYY